MYDVDKMEKNKFRNDGAVVSFRDGRLLVSRRALE